MAAVRLHVLSDLHLEHAPFDEPPADADVIVLAGDIGTGTDGVAWAREWAGGRPVLYVAGNHEFYGERFPDLIDDLRAEADGSTVQVLESDEVVIGDTRFLGCALWSDFAFAGPEHRERSMSICERLVNDYGQIRVGPEGRRLTPADTLAVHRASRDWLAQRLAAPWSGPTVVITHHQPVITGRPDQAVMQAIAGAFASDLATLMGADRVGLWIYGHTHRSADLHVAGTRIVSNPRGYPHQPVAGFQPGLVIDVFCAGDIDSPATARPTAG
jgi:predicted phosphodiesterase